MSLSFNANLDKLSFMPINVRSKKGEPTAFICAITVSLACDPTYVNNLNKVQPNLPNIQYTDWQKQELRKKSGLLTSRLHQNGQTDVTRNLRRYS